jgi:tRNA threonylcarbamoyl adenosine modification protein YjeE
MLFESRNEARTAALGARLAAVARPGDVLFLTGPLGAGKTVFARAFIRALTGNPAETVPSPTFSLVQVYEGGRAPVYHFDLYRIGGAEEVFELGWEEARAGGIALVEWPERLGPLAPAARLDLAFEAGEGDIRRIALTDAGGAWDERLRTLRPHEDDKETT